MKDERTDAAQRIDALTVAGEFLMCAVRALAMGSPHDDPNVSHPLKFAQAKIDEAMGRAARGLDAT